MEHGFLNLHLVQNNLKFWESKAMGTNGQKAYFMLCERGPSAFVDGTIKFIRSLAFDGSHMDHLHSSTATYISEMLTVLTRLRYFLSTFLAQVYMEIDRVGELLIKDPVKSLPSFLSVINDLFMELEASIGYLHAARQSRSSVVESYSVPLMFDKLPEVNEEGSQWTECEVKDALNLLNQNLQKLDSYISTIVAKHRKPSNLTLHWMRYTCGFVGLAVCSMWTLRHSSLMGSPDVENWISEAKESTIRLWNHHVPVLALRGELFNTLKKRDKGAMEPEEVRLIADSLHRYGKQIMHPAEDLVAVELIQAQLLQLQKIKLDLKEAQLELDEILKANQIILTTLAALPAFLLSRFTLKLLRAWFKQDASNGNLLLAEIEGSILQYEHFKTRGQERDAACMFGLTLYGLDSLYCAVKNSARATGQWTSLRADILDLGRPNLPTARKLRIISEMERAYHCLVPRIR